MKTFVLTLAAAVVSATTAFATPGVGFLDANGDSFASFSEVRAVYPGFNRADFRDLDTNNDRRLSNLEVTSREARRILSKQFDAKGGVLDIRALDNNGDRFASLGELRRAYPGLRRSDFRDLDTNNDRRVSSNELLTARAQVIISRHDEGSTNLITLAQVDTNGSNFAEFSELKRILPKLSRLDFQRVDANNDNRLSFVELYDRDTLIVFGQNR